MKKSDPYKLFNSTKKEDAELLQSIKSVGLKNGIIVDETGKIIDGHRRRDACIILGIDWHKNIDKRTGMTDDEKKCLAIELNCYSRAVHLSQKKTKRTY